MNSIKILSPKEVKALELDISSNYNLNQADECTGQKSIIDLNRAKEYVNVFEIYGVRLLEALAMYVIAEIPDDYVTDKGMLLSLNRIKPERIKYTVDRLSPLLNGSKLSYINRFLLKVGLRVFGRLV